MEHLMPKVETPRKEKAVSREQLLSESKKREIAAMFGCFSDEMTAVVKSNAKEVLRQLQEELDSREIPQAHSHAHSDQVHGQRLMHSSHAT